MVESPYPEDIVAQKSPGTLWSTTSLPRKMEDPRDPEERDWVPDTHRVSSAVYRNLASNCCWASAEGTKGQRKFPIICLSSPQMNLKESACLSEKN